MWDKYSTFMLWLIHEEAHYCRISNIGTGACTPSPHRKKHALASEGMC